jgi:hypothetical protein
MLTVAKRDAKWIGDQSIAGQCSAAPWSTTGVAASPSSSARRRRSCVAEEGASVHARRGTSRMTAPSTTVKKKGGKGFAPEFKLLSMEMIMSPSAGRDDRQVGTPMQLDDARIPGSTPPKPATLRKKSAKGFLGQLCGRSMGTLSLPHHHGECCVACACPTRHPQSALAMAVLPRKAMVENFTNEGHLRRTCRNPEAQARPLHAHCEALICMTVPIAK